MLQAIYAIISFTIIITILTVPGFFMLGIGLLRGWYIDRMNGLSFWLGLLNLGLAGYFTWMSYRGYRGLNVPIPDGFSIQEFFWLQLCRLTILSLILLSLVMAQWSARKSK